MAMRCVRWMLLAVSLVVSGCFPFEAALSGCSDSGRCLEADGGDVGGEADAGAREDTDAGPDLELAQWPVPAEAPSDYLIQGGVVLDRRTGLAWQQGWAAGTSWADAMAQCEQLNTAGYGGHTSGWRLPTAIELLSLVDSSTLDPAINGTAFPNTPSTPFWTASAPRTDAGVAWEVGFSRGDARLLAASVDAGVRCLRSGASPGLPRFRRDDDAGVVRDEVTRLAWEAGSAPAPLSHADALLYCAGLALDGADGGWRLPAKKELETLVDRRAGGSLIDPSPFSSTAAGTFWSATPVKEAGIILLPSPPPASWTVDFSNGQSTETPEAFLRHARCVR